MSIAKCFVRTGFSLSLGLLLGLGVARAEGLKDDALLTKFADWHLGFTTNQAQHDADLANEAKPRWALSELRFHRIWSERDDGYWIYYETSQPDVRPDRNEIWRLYRSDLGDLKVDIYAFNDTARGLAFWGKGADAEVFDAIAMDELSTRAGCNATYHWLPDFERFVGTNPHGKCTTIGASYLLQHVEIGLTEDGTLERNDWHSFYDENGVAKVGAQFKFGDQGAYRHLYTERYALD